LLTAGVAFAFALSLALYVGSFVGEKKLLAKGGDSGNALYDFFIGRELNPRLLRGAFDLKVFCELTPGLIGWLLLDLGFAHQQFLNTGRVSPAMALVCAFQGIYVLDALWFEPAILTTMDVTTDGFGFMLAFGDLVWVPFTYSLQARYILENDVALEPWFVCLVVTIKIIGYVVFRGSNGEKNRFRQNPNDPSVKHLKYLPTARGTRLLISGWWGMARHINYFGDWLMAWAWCLPCGFRDVVPYFYVVYFGVLLVHRDQRDQEACREKYGKDWDAYCAIVRWRFCPYVY
jgi:protein-S-isoprenylcysteine O-methyltransferase Ste14